MGSNKQFDNDELLAPLLASKGEEEVEVLWSADLPPEEDTNPALWNALLLTFREALEVVTTPEGLLVFSEKDALERLKWRGRAPTCGKRILQELRRNGDIVPAPDCASLVSMTHTGQQKRTQMSLWQWTRSFFASNRKDATDFCMEKTLQSRAMTVKRAFEHITKSESMKTMEEIADDFCDGNVAEAMCIGAYLAKTYKWSIAELSPGHYGLKSGGDKLTESDLSVLKTRELFRHLHKQEEKLIKAAEFLLMEAKQTMLDPKLSKATKDMKATSLLKRRKFTQSRAATVQQMSLNVQKVLSSIDEAHSASDYVSCMEESSATIRQAQIDVERIDMAMLEMEEVYNAQNDISDAIQKSAAIDPETEKALLEELHQLEETAVPKRPENNIEVPQTTAASTTAASATAEDERILAPTATGNTSENHAQAGSVVSSKEQLAETSEPGNFAPSSSEAYAAQTTATMIPESPTQAATGPASQEKGRIEGPDARVKGFASSSHGPVEFTDGKMDIESMAWMNESSVASSSFREESSTKPTDTASPYPKVAMYESKPSETTSLQAKTEEDTELEHAFESLSVRQSDNARNTRTSTSGETEAKAPVADDELRAQILPG